MCELFCLLETAYKKNNYFLHSSQKPTSKETNFPYLITSQILTGIKTYLNSNSNTSFVIQLPANILNSCQNELLAYQNKNTQFLQNAKNDAANKTHHAQIIEDCIDSLDSWDLAFLNYYNKKDSLAKAITQTNFPPPPTTPANNNSNSSAKNQHSANNQNFSTGNYSRTPWL